VTLLPPVLSASHPVSSALMMAAGVAWGIYSLRGKGSVDPDITITACISQRDINGVFVNVKTDKCDILLHDLPPWLWLCVVNFHSQHNPRLQGAGRLFSTDRHYV
jgi:hypothetical protein